MAKGAKLSSYPPGSAARFLCSCMAILLILTGITVLALYLIYRPSHPHFTVLGAAVYRLEKAKSAAPASAVATSMQFTVAIRNPNGRASLQLDRLCAYVSYRDQPITPPSSLPSLYEEADGTVAVSPVLEGDVVPVSAEVEAGLMSDEAYGVVALQLVITGRLRYRPGPFKSGWVNLYVKCDVLVGLKKGFSGQVPLLGQGECAVET
ncbi:hypothetical protein HPP92_014617 [Vanilla planifolia]|uniref:Late embryogenesis abundant protein LEA-2 subgroup domain-containing protein n=1 Tax=Vanilla planifolia TaxID=51239 RepID=A0A835QQR7_VANPL|nr:hypothetical protein HPP92_015049 [Vanilla planifolia]KAG0474931.1 hypothetical protein HPP92_014617 [Vanilla planifolia]